MVRRAVLAALWGALVAQFYTAGLGVFGVASFNSHAMLGYVILLATLVLLVEAMVARRGRHVIALHAVIVLLAVLQPVLVLAVRTRSPALAALHPLGGLAIALAVARVGSGVDARRRATLE